MKKKAIFIQRKVRPLVKAGGEVAADAPVLVVRVAKEGVSDA